MKKRLFTATMLVVLIAGVALAQDLANVVKDLNTVLEKLGDEITPYVVQGNLSGQAIGAASPPAGRWYLSVSALAVLSGGPLAFVEDTDDFRVLNVDGLFSKALSGSASDIYDLAKSFLPLPGLRLTVGLPDLGGNELIFLFSIFPQPVTALVGNAAGLDDAVLNRLNAGVRLRRPLIRESGGFPTISAGVGYTFSRFAAGLALPSDFSQDIGGQPLTLQGDLQLTALMNALGADLAVSRKLGMFVPFFRASTYLTWVHYSAEIKDFYAALGGTSTTGPVDVSFDDVGMFVLLTGGFELQGRQFALVASGDYSFDSRSPGVTLSARWQF